MTPPAALPALGSTQPDPSKEGRYRGLMERYLGPDVLAAMADDDVTEVYVNAGDGRLRADTHSRGKVALGATVRGDQVEQVRVHPLRERLDHLLACGLGEPRLRAAHG